MGKKKTKGKKNNRNRNRVAQKSGNHQNQERCNQQIRTQGYVHSDPIRGISPQEAYALSLNLVTDELLDNVLLRGVVKDERRLDERSSLQRYFIELVRGMSWYPEWFFAILEALLIGLANGPPWIDRRVAGIGNGEPWPILHWVCQWKLLRANSQDCYVAGDELVDMVLKAGASVNEVVANGTNAMFFAVKYADMMAIDALLKAGIDLQQRDEFGRTCLYNALEHPRLELIERLLEEGLDIHETFLSLLDENGKIVPSFEMSVSDRLLILLENVQEYNKTLVISWDLLGAPTSTDIGETLIMLRQKGAKLTETSSGVLSFIGHLFRDNYYSNLENIRHIELCKDVASYLVGNIVPERFVSPSSSATKEGETKDFSSDEECPICLRPTKHKPVTLCCGHSFCRKCLLNNGSPVQRCPLCRHEIGLDITLPDFGALPDVGTGHGPIKLDKIMGNNTKSIQFRGPTFLDENQLISEAKFRGIYDAGDSLPDLQRKLVESVFERADTELPLKKSKQLVRPVMDLAASIKMATDSHVYLGCGHGISCIEILVKGFPVLARVSNRSFYTVISSSVVNALGLKKIEQLKTRKFVGVNGKKMKNAVMTCLEPIVITIGDIDVTLRNAIEMAPPFEPMFGVQLGEDFLKSSRWCPIDFDLGKDSQCFMRSRDLNDDSVQLLTEPSKSMLRFYSNDGKSAHVPLLSFDPFKGETNLTISFKTNIKFDQCMWCSRAFPEGMLTCSICEKAGKLATYCDERCQLAGHKCHKRFHTDLPDTNASE